MSRQHQSRTAASRTNGKQKPRFAAPPVVQPKVSRKALASPSEQSSIQRKMSDPLARLQQTLAVQAQLTIGQPNDRYEQEADRVAKTVVQRIHSAVAEPSQPATIQPETAAEDLQTKPLLQRQSPAAGAASPELESAINRAKGHGQSLDAGLQQSMGEAMGADFSGVKVHTDAQSDQLNHSIQAKAFTTGQDVFFQQGAYQPGSRSGQELIAHELTHVVQQSQGGIQTKHQQNIQRASDPPDIQRVNIDDVPDNLKQRYNFMVDVMETDTQVEEIQDEFERLFQEFSEQDAGRLVTFLILDYGPKRILGSMHPETARHYASQLSEDEHQEYTDDSLQDSRDNQLQPGNASEGGARFLPMKDPTMTFHTKRRRGGDAIVPRQDAPDHIQDIYPKNDNFYVTNMGQYPYVQPNQLNIYERTVAEAPSDGKHAPGKSTWYKYCVSDKTIAEAWLGPNLNSVIMGIYIKAGGLTTVVPTDDSPGLHFYWDGPIGNGNLSEGHPLHVSSHHSRFDHGPKGQGTFHKHVDLGGGWPGPVADWITKCENKAGVFAPKNWNGKLLEAHTQESWAYASQAGQHLRQSLGVAARSAPTPTIVEEDTSNEPQVQKATMKEKALEHLRDKGAKFNMKMISNAVRYEGLTLLEIQETLQWNDNHKAVKRLKSSLFRN
ncbi:MAG: DUF4157 domain-containing protein [Cyanobacteria bacterium P01_G01_bin.54]